MSDKVSIVIPIYNVEKFLSKCIESVINQSYSNLEIILVDDGSADNSGVICDNYSKQDSRIKVIHKTNAGVSAARNAGIEAATGKYICFVDGDDYIMKDYVSYLLNLLISSNADISLTTLMFDNFNNKQTKHEKVNVISGEDACEMILCYKIPIGVYCKMFNLAFIKEHNIRFFESVFMGEGFNFNVLSFQNSAKIAVGNRKIYFYRRDNSTSATTNFSIRKCENSIYALEVMNNHFIIDSPRIKSAWTYAKWRTYSDAFDYMVLGDAVKNNKNKYEEYKKYIKNNAFSAKNVPISKKDKIRALIMHYCPNAIPLLLKLRRIKYKIKIEK